MKVLKWVIRSIIKSSQNLVRSEGVCVVIRVSLDSEKYRGRQGVPGVHLGDRLEDAILVLLSLKAVVLDVVYQLQEEHPHKSVVELVLQGLPAEHKEDC